MDKTEKRISNLTGKEYNNLKDAGMLWVYYPQASGDYDQDLLIEEAKEIISIDE